jgi:RimJ/RimL family protein N-acetyltransferase
VNITLEICNDSSKIQSILEDAPGYQLNIEGIPLEPTAGDAVLSELPLGSNRDQKHVLVVLNDGEEVGVVDLIDGYPTQYTCYIGLLLLRESFQGRSLGINTYRTLESWMLQNTSCAKLRLSYVKSNPVAGFWEKCGFKETGEQKDYISNKVTSKAVLMEKELPK